MKSQHGGFAVGMVVGVLAGLAIALGVALYVTKVPLPFVNKVPQRTAEQDAAEVERNKNWDPNAPLVGKPVRPGASGPAPATPTAATLPAQKPASMAAPAASAALPALASPTPAAPAAKVSKPGGDPFMYFAQAGAYTRPDDAGAQRAKLALLGADARVTEREQAGRTIYRVRVGPFDSRSQVDAMLERLRGAGVDSSLVRVERQ